MTSHRTLRLATLLAASLLLVSLAPALSAGGTAVSFAPSVAIQVVSSTQVAVPSSPAVASAPRLPFVIPSPDWINISSTDPAHAPPAAFGVAMAYDPVERATIAFGGCTASTCYTNQTWAFANGTWANLTDPHHAPPARYGASLDYDANMHGLLLFGGSSASGYRDDTWLFRAGVWTNLTWVSPAPPARYAASMAFDPAPEENGSVLFGGFGGGYLNDTWIWQGGSGWVPLVTSVQPAPTDYGGMAYDAADGVLLLWRSDTVNQTWELYSGQWWPVTPSGTVPLYAFASSMTYDPSLSGVLLFGGIGFSGFLSTTYLFAGNTWTLLTTAHAPDARAAAGIALDGTGSVPILFGGVNSTVYFGDTWVFESPPAATLAAASPTAETSAPVPFTVHVAGGTVPYTVRIDYGDNTTAVIVSSDAVVNTTHAYDHAGTYQPSVTVTDNVGAAASAASPSVTIVAGPAVSASVSPSALDVGTPFAFTSHVLSAGVPPLAFAWSFGDGSDATGQNASHAFSAAGTYTATVTATDAQGGVATATVTVQVNALPTATAAVVTASPTSGVPVALVANVSGGTAPFRFSWSFGDGSSSTFPAPTHTFNGTGTHTVQVWVNDSGGGSTHATVTVDVASVSASSAGTPLWFWAGLAALIAIAAVGATLLVLGNRQKRPPSPHTVPPGPDATPASSPKPETPNFPEDEL